MSAKSKNKKLKRYLYFALLWTAGICIALNACGISQEGNRTVMLVQLHAKPAGFQEVNIHIKRFETQQANGEWKVIGAPDKPYNLSELVNGNVALLGEEEVEPDSYTKARLVIGEENNVIKDSHLHILSTSVSSNVEMDIDVNLHREDFYVMNLDFDVLRSIKEAESGFVLIPVVRIYGEAETGTISGRVSLADETTARVNAIISDTVFTTTSTDRITGDFQLMGLEPGIYDIQIVPHQESLDIKTEDEIEVHAGETTNLGVIDFQDSNPLDDESWTTQNLAPGLELLQQHFNSQQYISILKIDHTESKNLVRITSTYLFDDAIRLPVSEFGEREDAIAAINAGHGRDGDVYNSGILKINGDVIPFLREEPNDALIWVGTSAFGIDSEENWCFTEREGNRWGSDWAEVEHAVAGSQMLISDGKIKENIEHQEYRSESERNHAGNRHPRTSVCLTENDVGLFITIDGRHPEAEGMTLLELSQYMKTLGCKNGINLDGGGSTTMWTKDFGVANHPSDNGQFDHFGQRDLRTAIVIKWNN